MNLPKTVTLVEVGPRDGLQHETQTVSVADRIALIHRLQDAGLRHIEAGSFTSARWVPQMAATADVLRGLERRAGVHYPVLVPNLRGLDDALAAGAEDIAVFTAASDSFNRKNINCDIADSIARFTPVIQRAQAEKLRVRGYVSCALGCPYEGDIAPAAVAEVAGALFEQGCEQISLGDTIGVGTPGKAQAMIETVARQVPIERLAAHFHDTYGQALANLYAVLQLGIGTIDSAVGGLGGCPYAPGAGGNVATEDVVYMLDGLGIETGVDLTRLLAAGEFICRRLARPATAKVALAAHSHTTAAHLRA